MNQKEQDLLKQNHRFLVASYIDNQNKDIVIMALVAITIVGFFVFGTFSLMESDYLYSAIHLVFSALVFILLRRLIRSSRGLQQEAFKAKDKFEEDFPELVDEELAVLHSKIKGVR